MNAVAWLNSEIEEVTGEAERKRRFAADLLDDNAKAIGPTVEEYQSMMEDQRRWEEERKNEIFRAKQAKYRERLDHVQAKRQVYKDRAYPPKPIRFRDYFDRVK